VTTPAVSTVAWDGHPWEAALDEAAALGLSHVEPAFIRGYVDFDEDAFGDAGAARWRRMLGDRGLAARAASAHMDLSGPDAGAGLARRVGFAAGIGAGVVIVNAGPAAQRDAILRTVEGALPRLEDAGVTLALENPGHGSGDLIGRGEDGAALVTALGHPRVKLNLDVGNLLTYAAGVEPGLSAALPHAVHAHLKDVADDGAGGWRFCALGEGLVDWGAAARAMGRLAPGPPVALELPLRLSRPMRRDPRRDAAPLPLPANRAAVARSLAAWAAVA
jgi:sugar phosphate isomerase/epimerase